MGIPPEGLSELPCDAEEELLLRAVYLPRQIRRHSLYGEDRGDLLRSPEGRFPPEVPGLC